MSKYENSLIAHRAISVRQFCYAYGIGRTTTYKLIATGRLKSIRIGGRRLIAVESAEDLINPQK